MQKGDTLKCWRELAKCLPTSLLGLETCADKHLKDLKGQEQRRRHRCWHHQLMLLAYTPCIYHQVMMRSLWELIAPPRAASPHMRVLLLLLLEVITEEQWACLTQPLHLSFGATLKSEPVMLMNPMGSLAMVSNLIKLKQLQEKNKRTERNPGCWSLSYCRYYVGSS